MIRRFLSLLKYLFSKDSKYFIEDTVYFWDFTGTSSSKIYAVKCIEGLGYSYLIKSPNLGKAVWMKEEYLFSLEDEPWQSIMDNFNNLST